MLDYRCGANKKEEQKDNARLQHHVMTVTHGINPLKRRRMFGCAPPRLVQLESRAGGTVAPPAQSLTFRGNSIGEERGFRHAAVGGGRRLRGLT